MSVIKATVSPVATAQQGDLFSIQTAINYASSLGGGTVFIRNGTYILNSTLTIPTGISLVGESEGATILDFNNTTANISCQGTLAYNTGTISVTNNSQVVTGSGTSWDNSLIGKYILLKGLYYLVVAVNSTTQIIIAFSFAGESGSGLSYVIASLVNNVSISNLTIQNSSSAGAALCFQYTSNTSFSNILFLNCLTGFKVINSDTSISSTWTIFGCNVGAVYTNAAVIQINGPFMRNITTGDGLSLINCNSMSLFNFGVFNATGRGVLLSSCTNYGLIDFSVNSCTGIGVEFISTTDGGCLGGVIANNTTDAIKFTSNSLRNTVTNMIIRNNGGWGVNIAASSNTNNLILGNIFSTNTSGNLTDSGTTTKIRSNIGPADN